MHVKCLFQKIQHAFLPLLKRVFTIRRKIYAVYVSVLFKKSETYLIWKDKIMFHAPLYWRRFDLSFGIWHKILTRLWMEL